MTTAPRSSGIVFGALFAALFVWTGWLAWAADDLVVPTNGVAGSSTAADDPAEGVSGHPALTARTELQRWRAVSGPSPANPQPPAANRPSGGPSDTAGVAAPNGPALVGAWLAQRAAQQDILQPAERVQGISSLPEEVRDVFVQPQGRVWRAIHNGPILFGGALYMIGVLAALGLFLAWRGRIHVSEGFSGERIPRFDAFERANHWMTATSFVLMALTGLVVLYGRFVLRPWLGADVFDNLAEASVWLHMSLILPFTVGILIMIALWSWQNLLRKIDWVWIREGGGIVGHGNPPAERFNAGQKLIFWATILSGLALIGAGLGMMFPFAWAGYTGIQLAQSIHATVALIMIGIIFGHIYIGTIGMEGAFEAMWHGSVDRNWAREHHSVWYSRMTEDQPQGSRPH